MHRYGTYLTFPAPKDALSGRKDRKGAEGGADQADLLTGKTFEEFGRGEDLNFRFFIIS
jgi:hypothetical protein